MVDFRSKCIILYSLVKNDAPSHMILKDTTDDGWLNYTILKIQKKFEILIEF